MFNIPATQQPVFTETFPNINFNPAPAIQIRPFTDTVTDSSGNALGTIPAQNNDNQAVVGPLYTFAAVFNGSLNVPMAGPATFAFSSDDAFVFGIGNGATRVSGPQTGTPSSTTFQGYPIMAGVNQREAPTANTITVSFQAAGVYPYELDYAKGGDNTLTLTMQSGGVPIPAAVLLTLSPNVLPSVQTGGVATLNVVATDPNSVAIESLPVTVNVIGNNPQSRPLTTDGSGQVGFSYAGNPLIGVDQVQATAIVNGASLYSNIVNVPWNSGTNQAPVVSAGAPQTVTIPGQAILTGTVTDDGLPNNTLTITWSMQSGPAPVVFDNPNQAATAATFTTAGSYVLQLSATDGALTNNSTLTITVDANTNWSSGWLASPLDQSTVTGQVTVTLIPGITLTSGTLTYFPAGHPEQGVAITMNGTSGQIGTFDTTLLNNGSYFVLLNATNLAGVTQGNQAYVTVVGDYKPGRVTATVTDFTVPAPGLPIQIQRTYDSLVRATSSDFGYGWKLGIRVDLVTSPTGDVTFTTGGRRRTFYFTPPPNPVFTYWYTPQYTGEPGLYGSLVNTGDNCTGVLVHTGNIWECALANSGNTYQPTGYLYTDAYGRQYTIGADGSLNSIKDLNNNTLTVTPTGITSSTGLNVPFVRDSSGRITQITDPLGSIYKYAYDTSGNLSTVTFPGVPTPAQYQYDSNHVYTGGTDPRGKPLASSTYDASGRLQTATDGAGNKTTYAYNGSTTTVTNPDGGTVVTVADSYGMPLTITDPLNHTTTNVYDSDHNLTSVTDPLGHTTTYGYDNAGNRTSTTYPKTATSAKTMSTISYNKFSQPTQVTDELSNVRNVGYDGNNLPQNVSDAIGPLVTFNFDANGTLQAQARGYDLTATPGHATTFTYDTVGNLISKTDPLNRQTVYTYDTMGNHKIITPPVPSGATAASMTTTKMYDALGNLKSVSAPLGRNTTYQYDGNGNKISETDPNGNTATYEYDALNRLTKATYPTTPATTMQYTYDFRNNVTDTTDQAGHVKRNQYDLVGRLTSATLAYGTPDAAQTTYTYFDDGRKKTETDPRGNTTTYFYDEAGRLVKVTDAKGNSVQYGYDDAGNRVSVTDANAQQTQMQYDTRRRLVKTVYNDGTSVVSGYDGQDNLTSVTDQANNTVRYNYDAANQLQSVVQVDHPDPVHNTTNYGYDVDGNLTSLADANGHTTQRGYDLLRECASETLPSGNLTQTWSFDPAGNWKTLTDFNGRTAAYGYDTVNRLLFKTPDPNTGDLVIRFTYTKTGKRATMTDASGTTTYSYDNLDRLKTKVTPQGTLSYTYDATGNPASMVSSNAHGVSTAYTWDELNRIKTVVDNNLPAGQNTTMYSYDPASNLATATYPNGVQFTFTYDDLNRLKTLNGYSYQLGPTGNHQSGTDPNGRTFNWTYDGIYRLTNENIAGGPNDNNGSVGYSLDPVGNRLSQNSSLPFIATSSFTYDPNDRLSSETYDNNGNTLVSGARSFAYDFENRLKSMTMNGTTVTLLYDGEGNRVAKTVGTVTTQYLVDDLNPTGYAQVVEELANGSVMRQYTYGLQRINEIQVVNSAWTPSFYSYDGMGSVRSLSDMTGAVTDTYNYDAWGNVFGSTGSTSNVYLYRGEQYDADLSLYYLRARYYNPLTGRFLMRDPACSLIADVGTLHMYLYAGTDPVNRIDPTGRASIVENLTVVGAVLFTGAVVDSLLPNTRIDGYQFTPAGALVYCVLKLTGSVLDNASNLVEYETGLPIHPGFEGVCTLPMYFAKKPRGHSDPIPWPEIKSPGPDPDKPDRCKPCPPPSPYWDQPGNAHGGTMGVHHHWWVWNQKPYPDCTCYPARIDGGSPPAGGTPWSPGGPVWP